MAFSIYGMAINLSDKCWYNVLAEELDKVEFTKKKETKFKIKIDEIIKNGR